MKKKIYVCPKCGRALEFSPIPEYTFYCVDCDEDFYEFEAVVKEQPKLEGIKDYTDLVEASIEISKIANKTIKENQKYIEIKSKNILDQIAEYIYETIRPILETDIHKHTRFMDCAAIYTNGLKLKFGEIVVGDNSYNACLTVSGRYISTHVTIGFHENGYKVFTYNSETINTIVIQNWIRLKESMNRMIPYALSEYNKYKQKELEKQKEMSDLVDNFRI